MDEISRVYDPEKEFILYMELVRIWNNTPFMANPTRTEMANKINDKIQEFIKRLEEYRANRIKDLMKAKKGLSSTHKAKYNYAINEITWFIEEIDKLSGFPKK